MSRLCLLSMLLMLAIAACDKPHSPASLADMSSTPQATSLTPEAQSTREVPSSSVIASHSETVPRVPTRIVSLAPNITEILFALGAGDRVVGVTRFCDHPEQVSEIARVGGFIDPDLEAMLAQSPDLVLGMKAGDASLAQKLDKANLSYVFLEMNDLDQTAQGMRLIGDLIAEPDRASALVDTFEQGLVPIPRPLPERPTTLFLFGHDPMIAAGHGTFAHELIVGAGGKNAMDANKGAYPKIDMEYVLKLNPDIIIDTTMVPGGEAEMASFWAPYESLRANMDDKIITINDPAFLRPGPRLPAAFARMKAIHAEGRPRFDDEDR